MTYRELAERIKQLNDYQKDCKVTYKHDDEYYGSLHMDFADVRTEDRLDGWHPYLTTSHDVVRPWHVKPTTSQQVDQASAQYNRK